MTTKNVFVIGAGIGGITAAIHLAKRGLHVTVVEKNSRPGGRCDVSAATDIILIRVLRCW